jgi:hypothetical protein
MELVERLVSESESSIPELQDELRAKTESQDRVLGFITYCLRMDEFPFTVFGIAKNVVL